MERLRLNMCFLAPAVANVDFALLVFALANPPFEEVQVSRFLSAMEATGLPFRLLLNKVDLVPPEVLERRVQQVRSWGYEPIVVSCEVGLGIEEAVSVLAGRTSVVAGPSGAGKSSLINAMRMGRHREGPAPLPLSQQVAGGSRTYGAAPLRIPASVLQPKADSSAQQSGLQTSNGSSSPEAEGKKHSSSSPSLSPAGTEAAGPRPAKAVSAVGGSGAGFLQAKSTEGFLVVGEMSRVGRGMHTTTRVTLIPLPGGARLADTPGFSQPTLEHVSSQELSALYPEFVAAQKAAGGCRFNNCMHIAEPGCVITAADPPMERYTYYKKFLAEIKEREETDVRVMQAGKRAREGMYKTKMDKGGNERSEARLEASKHRRTSRGEAKQRVLDAWNDQ